MISKVFPENMNPIDVADARTSLVTIDQYVRYICERVEHTLAATNTRLALLEERFSAVEHAITNLQNIIDQL